MRPVKLIMSQYLLPVREGSVAFVPSHTIVLLTDQTWSDRFGYEWGICVHQGAFMLIQTYSNPRWDEVEML